MRSSIAALSLTLLMAPALAQEAAPAPGANKAQAIAQIEEAARAAGGFAAALKLCNIPVSPKAREALNHYRRTILDVARAEGILEVEVDVLVEQTRNQVMQALAGGAPKELCGATEKRLSETVERYSLFMLVPPAPPEESEELP